MKQILLEDVTKKYGSKYIIRDVNQEYEMGESIAFVGNNGCGKSTLLKLISGIINPSKGKICHASPLRFSYIPEKMFPYKISARAYLMRLGEIDGFHKKQLTEMIDSLSEEFFIDDMLDSSMHTLSKGTFQKIGVIQALMKRPDVLLLDEPLSGQDSASQKIFVKKVNELRSMGTTIFMSCHEPALVKAISDRVFTIKETRLLPYEQMQKQLFYLYFENPKQLAALQDMEIYGTGYRILVEQEKTQERITELMSKGWILKGMYKDDMETI